ncbi:unnamed protein product [Albugo candida]|uniref:Uncharacterized protein n=1 Tax=Albugo candida TaxID=65357 RepID=A0A024GNK3_9STRA|nr:unnamed protein product [Albugo candida]|eukprot:CCI48121.1 unnamed protein product [Albugo candida]
MGNAQSTYPTNISIAILQSSSVFACIPTTFPCNAISFSNSCWTTGLTFSGNFLHTVYLLLHILVALGLYLIDGRVIRVATFTSETRILSIVSGSQITLSQSSSSANGCNRSTFFALYVVQNDILMRLQCQKTISHRSKIIYQFDCFDSKLALESVPIDAPSKLDIRESKR